MREQYQAVVLTAGLLALGAVGLVLSSCGVGTGSNQGRASRQAATTTRQLADISLTPFRYNPPQVSPASMTAAGKAVAADPFAGAEVEKPKDPLIPPPRSVISPRTLPVVAPYTTARPPIRTKEPITVSLGRYLGWIYNQETGRLCAIFADETGMQRTVTVGDEIDNLQVTAISTESLQLTDTATGEVRMLKLERRL
ncbi:MAG: hypothetical protein ACYDBB_17630 [Armatimonadota bacterium]